MNVCRPVLRVSPTKQLLPSTNGYYDIAKQADGSIEIWFGPEKPADVADNAFIQTIPGRSFLVAVRLYGTGMRSTTRPGSRMMWRRPGKT
ncbi:DUF1214 domain-containing protein [Pseudomonas sp. LA21]|uniref:DUF1214 domain-containing protein n=1 Tax=Pseudomonas sp. LA21 TaxID=2893373 RepID=UPI001FB7D405|nr:DUF1214 domain-containing protein [Pseudomonas sp. LA21]MCJ1888224.1 DUF1214 domain-containing protein [Pseudomonas sp. LA21]